MRLRELPVAVPAVVAPVAVIAEVRLALLTPVLLSPVRVAVAVPRVLE